MPKPKTVVIVKLPPTAEQIAADFPDAQDDKPLLFRPPLYRPIETPTDIFNTYMKQQRFIVAVHEVGHGLASMMVCRPTQALTVTEMNGSVRGGANMTDAHGEDSAIVDLGGIAAEQLVIGSGDCHAGASTDIENARQSLRDDRVPEHQIEVILQSIHRELITTFERDWLPGIVYTATKLAQVDVLEWDGFVELMAQGQRRAFLAGSLQKAANLLATHDTLHKSIARLRKAAPSEFEALASAVKSELRPQRRAGSK
ncbi:MAG: hypothetical protein WAV85_16015 [Rhodoferax sp.]